MPPDSASLRLLCIAQKRHRTHIFCLYDNYINFTIFSRKSQAYHLKILPFQEYAQFRNKKFGIINKEKAAVSRRVLFEVLLGDLQAVYCPIESCLSFVVFLDALLLPEKLLGTLLSLLSPLYVDLLGQLAGVCQYY